MTAGDPVLLGDNLWSRLFPGCLWANLPSDLKREWWDSTNYNSHEADSKTIEKIRRHFNPGGRAVDQKTTEQLTTERGRVHGDFSDVSRIAQALKQVAHDSPNWKRGMTDAQCEGVDMILHKVARILCGDPSHHDHWADISGYAHIVLIRTPAPPQKASS